MSKVIADLSMSLDGFIAEPNVSVEVPMNEGGERLHEWLSEGGVDAEIARELSETAGATVVGRRMFDVGLGSGRTLHTRCRASCSPTNNEKSSP